MQRQNFRRSLVAFSAVLFAVLTIIPAGVAWAAGNAAYSSESSPTVQTANTIAVSVYVTPSGASMWSGSVDVSLTNLTFQSYSAAGVPFGIAQVVAGNTAGSTSFTIGVAHTSGSGSTGKTLIGTVTLNATGAGGTTGQIQLSNPQADDFDLSPMAGSVQGTRSITITAPPDPVDPGSGGNGGSGGNQGGSGGNSGGSGGVDPNKTNPVDNPNPDSTTNVPDASGAPETVSEDEFSRLATVGIPDDTVATTVTKKASNLPAVIGVAMLGAVVLFLAIYKFILPRFSGASSNIPSGSIGNAVVGGPTVSPTESKPKDPDPPTSNTPSGPTIIRPQQ